MDLNCLSVSGDANTADKSHVKSSTDSPKDAESTPQATNTSEEPVSTEVSVQEYTRHRLDLRRIPVSPLQSLPGWVTLPVLEDLPSLQSHQRYAPLLKERAAYCICPVCVFVCL